MQYNFTINVIDDKVWHKTRYIITVFSWKFIKLHITAIKVHLTMLLEKKNNFDFRNFRSLDIMMYTIYLVLMIKEKFKSEQILPDNNNQ